MEFLDNKSEAVWLIRHVFGRLIKRAKQTINHFTKIGFYEKQKDWEFHDTFDFWRSFEGPQHWSSAQIQGIDEKKRSEKSFINKITLDMHFSNFIPTIPGWNVYKEFNQLWVEVSVGKKSTIYKGIKTESLIPALGYSMIRPPVLLKKKLLLKREFLYLSAFRRIVPDGILVYLGSEVINDGRFQKVIDILNKYGSVDMRLRGVPEQVKTLLTPSDKFFKAFVSELKKRGIGIPNLEWGRIRVESPDDIDWETVTESTKLEGAGSIWNAIECDDGLCFFQKSIHLGVDYYKSMLTQAARDIEWEIRKLHNSPLFSIDAYSNIFDNAQVIPWKTNEVYDRGFLIKAESFSNKKVVNMDSEFLRASHMSYIKGFKKEIQLFMNEAKERQKERDYEKTKNQLSKAAKLANITLERIEPEKLMSSEIKWFKKKKMELDDMISKVKEWCS